MAENIKEKLKEFISKDSWTELPDKAEDHDRPSPDQYFMKMAHLASERATCQRRKVGAVIVKNKHLLSTGYNGNPKGMKHCDEIGCLRTKLEVPSGERHELCTGLHAEQNAIGFASRNGLSTKDSDLYISVSPCIYCAKLIWAAGIKNVYYIEEYDRSIEGIEFLNENNIKCKELK